MNRHQPVLYFRRQLGDRNGAAGDVIYAVRVGVRTDPVDVLGVFPPGWRPTDFPGQVLHEDRSTVLYARCQVPRSQFRHYTQLSSAEVENLYPALVRNRDDHWPRQRAT